MRCPHCHADMPHDARACPHCGKTPDERDKILEPELVDEHMPPTHPGRAAHGGGYGTSPGFTRIFYTSFPGEQAMPPACLPTITTLILALLASLNFGLLAGIGFLFFAALGRAMIFFMSIRHLLEGRFFNPWIPHLLTWFICWMLVAWLSGHAG
ncbi:MAG: hypothetical protein J1E80_04885 [Desulfovibrionaceae bacterium]|nr:hypothetical protein [Desulfovibrionaceae bacterium]